MAIELKDKAITVESLKVVYDQLKSLVELLESSIPTIDATLAISGNSADAKATGDAIAVVQATIKDLDEHEFVWGMMRNGFGYKQS